MNTFYLVRHGEQVPVSGDPELSERGVKQAESTAKFFKDKKIDEVVSSPIKRAKLTAEIIAKELELDLIIDERLRERFNWGDIPGQSFEQFLEVWRKTIIDRHYQPKYGDSSHKAGARLIDAITTKSQEKDDQHIIFVSHGGVISDTLRSVLGDEQAGKAGVWVLRASGVSHCSITTLTEDKGKITVVSCDEVGHIE